MSASTRTTAGATTTSQSAQIFVPGGGRTFASPSPTQSSIILPADSYGGWSCEANNSCNSTFTPAVIATITIMSVISFMSIFGMILWVRMRTKRDTDVGQAQKQRRDRYLNRRSGRSRQRKESGIASLSLSRLQKARPVKQGSGHSIHTNALVENNNQQLINGQIIAEPQQFIPLDHQKFDQPVMYNQPSTSNAPPAAFVLTTQPPQNGGWFAMPAGPPILANPQVMASVPAQQPIQVYHPPQQ